MAKYIILNHIVIATMSQPHKNNSLKSQTRTDKNRFNAFAHFRIYDCELLVAIYNARKQTATLCSPV